MSVRITDNITPSLKKIAKNIGPVPEDAFEFWRKITPKRTGNARRRTRFNNNTTEAQYAYAQNLDQGASRQAPQGMSEPTIQFLDKAYNKAIRK